MGNGNYVIKGWAGYIFHLINNELAIYTTSPYQSDDRIVYDASTLSNTNKVITNTISHGSTIEANNQYINNTLNSAAGIIETLGYVKPTINTDRIGLYTGSVEDIMLLPYATSSTAQTLEELEIRKVDIKPIDETDET